MICSMAIREVSVGFYPSLILKQIWTENLSTAGLKYVECDNKS